MKKKKNPISIDGKKRDISNIYRKGKNKHLFNEPKSRIKMMDTDEIIRKTNEEEEEDYINKKYIPTPLQSKIFPVEDNKSSSSEEGQVPLTYYERQYQEKLDEQCK